MKKRDTFYATIGGNGGIITDDYERALFCKVYLRGHVYIKKFSDFGEAEDFLWDHLNTVAPAGCPLPTHFRLNKMVTIRKLLDPEREEE